MFPLGTVLLPGELLPLHVFEHRYRVMVSELLGEHDARPATAAGELGIVLIERGHEVGGGDERFEVACLARVVRSERAPDGRYAIVVVGIAPVNVTSWLDDDPYPRALVADRALAVANDGDVASGTARVADRAEALAAALGGELDRAALPDDPDALVHRLAASIGVGPLDRQRLLEAPNVAARLSLLADLLDDALTIAALRRQGPDAQ